MVQLLLLLLLLLLHPLHLLADTTRPAVASVAGPMPPPPPPPPPQLVLDGQCAWRTCHAVTVDRPSGDAVASGVRNLVLHRCRPGNDFPDKCYLSEVASDLDGVRNFTMRRAQLTAAPLADFCRYPRLAVLDLAENSIDAFAYPEALPHGCLSQLSWFSLRANAIREADLSQFMRLPGLERLDLSENSRLESLYMSQLPQRGSVLKMVLASKCRIKQVDISLVRLPSLQDVDLSYNVVSRVTNRLDWRWTLKDVRAIEAERIRRRTRDPHYYARLSIKLVQNQIGPEAFNVNTLWGLQVPDLVSEEEPDQVVNQLKLYRDAFQSFLYVDNVGSTITCDCHLLHAWGYFRRVHRDPAEFSKRNALSLDYWMRLPCEASGPSARQMGKQTLASLSASDLTCVHTDGCPPGCACLERVTPSQLVVDCQGVGLSAMPARLPVSVHPVRYVLRLANNRIRSLTAPPNATLVQELDLSGNRITEEADFGPLDAFAYLHSLNLTGNPLRRIPPSLLELGRRSIRPSVLIGPARVHCDCGLFEPDSWERMRRLFPDLRDVRCVGPADSGAPPTKLSDYRLQHCSRRVSNTTIVYKERHVFSQPVVLCVGFVSVGLFLLALVATVLVVRRYRRPLAAAGASKGPLPQVLPDSPHRSILPPPPPPPPPQPLPQQLQGFGCVSPDYLPPGCLPYEMPRYVATHGESGSFVCDRRSATLVFLRGGACREGAPGRRRSSANSCSSSSSSSSSSTDGCSNDSCDEGDRCSRHRGHGRGRHAKPRCHSHSRRRSVSRQQQQQQQHQKQQQQSMRLLREREMLLPPPLPPRPPSADGRCRRSNQEAAGPWVAPRVTDV